MSNTWRDDVFDSLVRLKRGHDLPNQNIVEGKFPIVASSGIKDFHNDYKAEPPIVVTGRSGTLGEVQYITQKSWPLNTTLYSIDFKGNYPKYVYYYLKEMHLENFNAGAGVPTLNQNHLQKLKIKIPSIEAQKKIAAILSAYDDLIENNKQRIKLLENMAEELYKEWFVRFRFPNWQNTEFEKGIPKGWVEQLVSESFDVCGGGTPSKEVAEYWENGEINWFTPSDLTSRSTLFIEESELKCNDIGLNKSSAKIFPAYSVMMTSRATIGVLSINTTEACTNQGFITCRPNKEFPLCYLYHWLKMSKPYFEILASGATFAELSRGSFKKIKIYKPNVDIVEKFDAICKPIFDEVLTLQKQLDNLNTQKNSLLPRLISGKLSVQHLNIHYPPSMQ